ncbi:MAG: class I SAM-dependent methyltransferase [Clostridia bacterium]
MQNEQNRAPMLGARLQTALSMAEPCAVCADIGADHGRLSAALLLQGKAQHVLAADVSEKALSKARRLLQRLVPKECVTFAVADGLEALNQLPSGHADVIFILGMGGETAAGILTRGQSRLQGAKLVLGAQTDLDVLRQTLCAIRYRITHEEVAREGGRFYVLMKCEPAQANEACCTEKERLLGPALLRDLPPEWQPMLERRKRLLTQAIAAMKRASLAKDAVRLQASLTELGYIEEALLRYMR